MLCLRSPSPPPPHTHTLGGAALYYGTIAMESRGWHETKAARKEGKHEKQSRHAERRREGTVE